MGTELVDQVLPDGSVFQARDARLSEAEKNALLLSSLPGASVARFVDERVVRYRDQILLKKQVTHLGRPWPGFKKRIQIPNSWLGVEREARAQGLQARFIGIYHHRDVTVFVDFDPTTYVLRKANNSAAHVATNDLHQAQRLGEFSREDGNGNRLTSVRSDHFNRYLHVGREAHDPRLGVLERFNARFLTGEWVDALPAVKRMHAAAWPDAFQGEWPGFFLEFCLDQFLQREGFDGFIQHQKFKASGGYDYDLVLKHDGQRDFYGDLKASDVTKHESPGNDAGDLRRCVEEFGRFWYVVFEHETTHARDHEDMATVQWNEWKRSVGHAPRGGYSATSYSGRFKQSVRFVKMSVLEVNKANFQVVLGDFTQGRQPSGAARELKVMIKKRNVDNFLIYSSRVRA